MKQAALLAHFALFFLVAACEPKPPLYGSYPFRESRSYSWGLREISELYVIEQDPNRLMLDGLNGVSEIDPNLTFHYDGPGLVVSLDGRPVETVERTQKTNWFSRGLFMTDGVDAARKASDLIDSASRQDVLDAVYRGMLSGLDESSWYLSPNESESRKSNKNDSLGAVSIRIRRTTDGAKVYYVSPELNPQNGALHEGDVILSVGGRRLVGLSISETRALLQGPIGSRVDLTIGRRNIPAPIAVTILRDHGFMPSMLYEMHGGILYLRIFRFNRGSVDALEDLIGQQIDALGRDLEGMALDLRGNSGGELSTSVQVADLFVSSGLLSVIHGRHPSSHQYFDSQPGDILQSVPMVVLVDGGTSAGGELVAAALQDSARAVIIGSATQGYGAIKTVSVTPNDGRMALTWGLMFAPSGYALHGRGVLPNICTAYAYDAATVIEEVRNTRRLIPRGIRSRDIDPTVEAGVREFKSQCQDEDSDSGMLFQVASRLLVGPSLYERARDYD